MTIGDADFETVTATIVAQSALSGFVSFAAFGLLLFLEPPSRFFTGWTGVSPDKRPTWLALALSGVMVAVLNIDVVAHYFGLVTPGHGPEWLVYAIALPVWFLLLRTIWRRRWFDRILGLQQTYPARSTPSSESVREATPAG